MFGHRVRLPPDLDLSVPFATYDGDFLHCQSILNSQLGRHGLAADRRESPVGCLRETQVGGSHCLVSMLLVLEIPIVACTARQGNDREPNRADGDLVMLSLVEACCAVPDEVWPKITQLANHCTGRGPQGFFRWI